jgi:hypothetical protein
LGAPAQLSAVDSRFPFDLLSELPTGGNAFSVLETMQAEATADRFNSGGLNGGGPGGIGSLLGSRRHTRFRVGDVEIGSPTSGAPLLFPEIALWQRVDVSGGLTPVDRNGNGLAISLLPHRPPSKWTGTAEAIASGAPLVAAATATPSPIAQMHQWNRGAIVAGGPIARGAGILFALTSTDSTSIVRSERRLREYARSAFVHLTMVPAAGRELRMLGWVQAGRSADVPQATTQRHVADVTSFHVQSTFEQGPLDDRGVRFFAGYTQQHRHAEDAAASRVVDRLLDGPIPEQLPRNDRTERRWILGTRVSPQDSGSRQRLTLGAEYSASASRELSSGESIVRETVDGIPARVWEFTSPGSESHRHDFTAAAYASDRISLSPALTLDAGVRFELVKGFAEGAATGIAWFTALPRVAVQWEIAAWKSTLFSGYGRSAPQLTHDLLAYGDPAAPVGRVFRWDTAMARGGTLIARVGPGTGADAAFSRIDPQLERPLSDEFVLGLELRTGRASRVRVAGVTRRETSSLQVVNVGVPASGYRLFSVADVNADLVGASDDQQLPVYERLPETFGADRYLLTNPTRDAAVMGAIVISAQVETPRLFFLLGATAAAVVGEGGNRGYRADENDLAVIGELFSNPNASTYARGRLFTDRAYTVKWTTVYRFDREIRVGVIVRYQDGQPFSRIVVVPGLSQGAEAIQAFANGRSRFAFTGTLDLRVQKGLRIGRARLDVLLDVYNVLNMQKEVEENVVTGPDFRTSTAVQPPRALHLGARVKF